jgi:beta-N-acetylhexosaminidase
MTLLTDLVRQTWQYKGVLITDSMDMQAIASHYGAGEAALMALQAGNDMVMALGNNASVQATLSTLTQAITTGQISHAQIRQRLQRLDTLAQHYPVQTNNANNYLPEQEAIDTALMQQAWQRALTPHRHPTAPPLGSKVRVVIKADASSDGVSEAGLSAQQLQTWLANYYDVTLSPFRQQEDFLWHELPADGRYLILASTSRTRYGSHACQTWRPDLHLCLWNPFHALDIDAPAVISYGFAPPALQAVAKWLQGELPLAGKNPCLPD